MRLILSLILCVLTLPAFADFQSEKGAIEKFEREVYQNPDNYLPTPPGALPGLKPEFLARLKKDPRSLKYFFILVSETRWKNRYKLVKPFALHLEAKFDGKALTSQQQQLITEVIADFILADPDLVITKAFGSIEASNEYFESNMIKLQDVTFK